MRSRPTRRSVMAMTGVPRIKMMLVAYCAQINRGRRNQVIPRARMVGMVTTKFNPVRMEEKPLVKTPITAGGTAGFEYTTARGGERIPPGAKPPVKKEKR